MTGVLTADAEYRRTTQSHAFLTVYISQGPGTMPWRATQHLDTSPSTLIAASAKAHRLRRGMLVTVWAKCVLLQQTRPDHLHLDGVTDITEHQPQPFRTEPAP